MLAEIILQASVTKQRAIIAHELQLASREHGHDIQSNPRLATVVAAAKKQGFPKQSIENAIKRGQGISPTGATLESLTVEAMIPPAVAVIIECQTDAKARLLGDLKLWVKEAGGSTTPISHLFDRRGRIVLENTKGLTEGEVFEKAIEAGATDIELEDDDKIVIHTEPDWTMAAAKELSRTLDLKVLRSDIIWDPKEDMMVDVPEPKKLRDFLDRVQDDPNVQEVYVNAN